MSCNTHASEMPEWMGMYRRLVRAAYATIRHDIKVPPQMFGRFGRFSKFGAFMKGQGTKFRVRPRPFGATCTHPMRSAHDQIPCECCQYGVHVTGANVLSFSPFSNGPHFAFTTERDTDSNLYISYHDARGQYNPCFLLSPIQPFDHQHDTRESRAWSRATGSVRENL